MAAASSRRLYSTDRGPPSRATPWPPGGVGVPADGLSRRSAAAVDDTRDRIVRKGDYIHGSFLKPEVVDGYINGVNPGDRADVLGRFPFSEASADEAVELARAGARIWRRCPSPTASPRCVVFGTISPVFRNASHA